MVVDLSIVIVNWNVRELLRQCLQSVYDSADGGLVGEHFLRIGDHDGGYGVDVWVVDNDSSDGSVEMVRDDFSWVHLIPSGGNLGFSKGNNMAMRRCPGRSVLLLNPDTQVTDGALVTMLDWIASNSDVGIVGPQLRYGDGVLQSSRRRFPTLTTAYFESTLLEQWWPNNRWARAYRFQDKEPDHVQDVDWLVGACMLVRREAIDQVGLLDERFFMYSEEMDWCKRIVDAGWRVVYLPDAVVVHHEGRSSDQVRAMRDIYFGRSKVAYFAKHHGALSAGLLRHFLLGTFVWQWLREAAKYLIGHKRALRRERMTAYAKVLRSGLR